MSSLNKALLIGRLGKDPELRHIPNGNAVANFSVATFEKWTDKDTGEKKEKTVWHNIVVWGKLAEICHQYLKKGSLVYLEGRIENRSYDDKDGNKKYISEIVLDMGGKMVMLGGKGEGAAPGEESQAPPAGTIEESLPF